MGTLSVLTLFVILVTYTYGRVTSPQVYDTIVIGLGPAGTAAAATLAQAGKKVLALEAQNRIGGRVNTVPFGDSTVEVGAQWIHGIETSSVYELAVKNNITILEQRLSYKVYHSDGSSDREDIINDLTAYSVDLAGDPPEDPEPLGQYITKRVNEYIKTKYPPLQNDTEFMESFLEFMNQVMNSYDSSNNWNDITTDSKFQELGGRQDMSWHTVGYKTIFDILLNKYNNGPGYPSLEIKLNTEVTNIQWPQNPADNVVVTVKDGATYTARVAIVTVSLGVLKERYADLFSPALPPQKIRAVEVIPIGVCNKIILRYPSAWWGDATMISFLWRRADKVKVSEQDKWILKINGAAVPMSSPTTLTYWTCGDAAKEMEKVPEDVVKSKVMELTRMFMGVNRTIPEPVEMMRSTWYSNPFTRGSYSYEDINLPKYPTARADLGAPLLDSSGAPRVLFAGEATDLTHFSTVHGAIDSGRREATRILTASPIKQR